MDTTQRLSSVDRYERVVLPENLRSLVSWIPAGSAVLELGASTGYMAAAMRAEGSTVVAVEYDVAALPSLTERADEAHIADVEDPSTMSFLDGRTFDFIIVADVLEHLVDPEAALARCSQWLTADGRVLVCMPNVAYWTLRLALARGRWETTKSGLMDETHLRWFTRSTAERMFASAGFDVVRMQPVWFEMPFDNRVRTVAPRLEPLKRRINHRVRERSPELFAAQLMWELRACV